MKFVILVFFYFIFLLWKNNEGIFFIVFLMWVVFFYIFVISKVLYFLLMEFFNIWVSLFCLNGIWFFFLFVKVIIVCFKKVSDLLMYMVFIWVLFIDRVFFSCLDLVKFIKFSLEVMYFVLDLMCECDLM